MSYHHIEVASIVVCLIAAVVYLVVEFFDFRVWWNKKRTPEVPSWKRESEVKPQGDSWTDEALEYVKDVWRDMFGKKS